MVRLGDMTDGERNYHEVLECPTFDTEPWVAGPSLSERRVAIISTAGLHTPTWQISFGKNMIGFLFLS